MDDMKSAVEQWWDFKGETKIRGYTGVHSKRGKNPTAFATPLWLHFEEIYSPSLNRQYLLR